MSMKNISFNELLGKTLAKVVNENDERIRFTTIEGEKYVLHYEQDCCATCSVQDIEGDLSDLIGHPLLQAEASSSDEKQLGEPAYADSFTWTFYKLATIKGSVTIRWLGESNGYYSESVTFSKE